MWRFYWVSLGLALISCSTAPFDASTATEESDPANMELGIGAACTETDGWQAMSFACPPSDGPTVCPPPAGHVERHQLPPGVRYCLVDSPLFPGGYFTSNCSIDDDCPTSGFCDGDNCRSACVSDDDCRTPSHCVTFGSKYPFCQAPQNMTRM